MEGHSFVKVLGDLAAIQEGLGKLANEHQRLLAERDALQKENCRLREDGINKTWSAKTALPLFARQAVPALGDISHPLAEEEEDGINCLVHNSTIAGGESSVAIHAISGWMENQPSMWQRTYTENCSQVQKERIFQKWTWIVKAALQSSQGYGLRSCWIMEPVNIPPAAQASGAEVINGMWATRGSWMLRVKTRFSVRATAALKEQPQPDSVVHQKRCLAIHPMSWKRASWVMLAMAFMAVETLMFSMQVYEKDPFRIARVLDIFGAVFWTTDILVSFMTGNVHSDRIELRLSAIAWRYARTWFAFDAFLCVLEWSLVVGHARTTVSYMRLLRIVRFAKFDRLMSESLARLNSLQVVLGVKIMFTILCLMFWIHLGGCVWYYIGKHTHDGWVHKLHLSEAELEQKYILATHWAIGQLQGGVDIYPGNPVGERVYAVGYTMSSICVLGAFVSTLTNVMFELHQTNKRRTWEWRILCQMLSAHKISLETSSRIKAYIRWKQHVDQKREMDAQEVIQNLPTELGKTLLIEMRKPYIVPHPVFDGVRLIHERSFLKMCSESFIPHTPVVNEQIYCHGDRCTQMYFVVGGSVVYVHYGAAAQAVGMFGTRGFESDAEKRVARCDKSLELTRDIILNEGRWLCEASLWLRWLHKGDLTTHSSASLLVLSPESFSAVAAQHPALHVALNSHARRFARTLDSVAMFFATDLYDTAAAVASMQQICANELIP